MRLTREREFQFELEAGIAHYGADGKRGVAIPIPDPGPQGRERQKFDLGYLDPGGTFHSIEIKRAGWWFKFNQLKREQYYDLLETCANRSPSWVLIFVCCRVSPQRQDKHGLPAVLQAAYGLHILHLKKLWDAAVDRVDYPWIAKNLASTELPSETFIDPTKNKQKRIWDSWPLVCATRGLPYERSPS